MGAEQHSTRRTIAELATLYSLYPHLRDVMVEGHTDRRWMAALIAHWGVPNVTVYRLDDRVQIDPNAIDAAGVEDGNRGRVISLAHAAMGWSPEERRCLTCVVDLDRDCIDGGSPRDWDHLLITDVACLEAYALTREVLSKFFAVVLRLDPPGDLDRFLDGLLNALSEFYLARMALHESQQGIGLPARAERLIKVEGEGAITISAEEIIERACPGAVNLALRTELNARAASLRLQLPADRRKALNGHDIAPLIVRALGLKNQWAHPEVVERGLLACVEWVTLLEHSLFARLAARLRAAPAA